MAGAYKYRPQYTQNTVGPSPATPALFDSDEPCPRCGEPLNQHQHSREEGCILKAATPQPQICRHCGSTESVCKRFSREPGFKDHDFEPQEGDGK